MVKVIKRDNTIIPFNEERIFNAVNAAAKAVGQTLDQDYLQDLAFRIKASAVENILTVEGIQYSIISDLMLHREYQKIAIQYVIYKHGRDDIRKNETHQVKTFNEIIDVEDNDVKNENANMNGNTPAGQMMKFASETTKRHAENYIINPLYVDAHKTCLIHMHDEDYYVTKTTTCVQYDLPKLFKDDFNTGHGFTREPKYIRSAAANAAIVFQTNQNEQHGGQSIPAFDHFMAPYVALSFKHYFLKHYKRLFQKEYEQDIEIVLHSQELQRKYPQTYQWAYEDVQEECDQAMEAFLANMNSMHSRGGNQTVFSSVNYGTDFSIEARMVMFSLLKATEQGLGHGETAIFPIQIFKVKEGINYSEEDFSLAIQNIDRALKGELKYKTPNFDLFVRSCIVSSKRLFPNFLFLDAPFNKHPKWDINDINRFKYEVATMGCRTRVFENLYGESTSWGRGNLSFTTINIVRLAIMSKLEAKKYFEANIKAYGYEFCKKDIEAFAVQMFFEQLEESCDMVAAQLYDRYKFQCSAKAKQFPFLMGQGLWTGGEKLKPNDRVESVLKHGTLGIGFIGLAECLKMLIGEHHGESDRAQELGLHIVEQIHLKCKEYKEVYGLNYSCLATPAEGLSGRFTKADKKEFGVIPGVTDREYYTNSNHIPVYFPISAYNKLIKEAPYHKVTPGGHISYVEMDVEAKKNPIAFMQLVRQMHLNGVGYGSINHPVDRCCSCGHEGAIDEECPICGETKFIDRIRRITGYLVGTLDRWNSYKQAEERDRIKHSI